MTMELPRAARRLLLNEAAGQIVVQEQDICLILASVGCAFVTVVAIAVVALWCTRRGADAGKGKGKEEVADGKEVCVICLAEYNDGEAVRLLPQCGHQFHADCIDTWLGDHPSCPSCRRNVAVELPAAQQ